MRNTLFCSSAVIALSFALAAASQTGLAQESQSQRSTIAQSLKPPALSQSRVDSGRIEFPLPKGAQLRPREEVTLMLPGALTNGHQKINSVLRVDDGAEVTFQKSLDAWHIKLKPGMTISLAKTCEIVIVADDRRPRFFSYMAPPRY